MIERIQKIGFPNSQNIAELEALIQELEKLSSVLKDPTHQISIERIAETSRKIHERLSRENDIPIKMYTTLNAQLIVFKENLIAG